MQVFFLRKIIIFLKSKKQPVLLVNLTKTAHKNGEVGAGMGDNIIRLVVETPVDQTSANEGNAQIGDLSGVAVRTEPSGIKQALNAVQYGTVIGSVKTDGISGWIAEQCAIIVGEQTGAFSGHKTNLKKQQIVQCIMGIFCQVPLRHMPTEKLIKCLKAALQKFLTGCEMVIERADGDSCFRADVPHRHIVDSFMNAQLHGGLHDRGRCFLRSFLSVCHGKSSP